MYFGTNRFTGECFGYLSNSTQQNLSNSTQYPGHDNTNNEPTTKDADVSSTDVVAVVDDECTQQSGSLPILVAALYRVFNAHYGNSFTMPQRSAMLNGLNLSVLQELIEGDSVQVDITTASGSSPKSIIEKTGSRFSEEQISALTNLNNALLVVFTLKLNIQTTRDYLKNEKSAAIKLVEAAHSYVYEETDTCVFRVTESVTVSMQLPTADENETLPSWNTIENAKEWKKNSEYIPAFKYPVTENDLPHMKGLQVGNGYIANLFLSSERENYIGFDYKGLTADVKGVVQIAYRSCKKTTWITFPRRVTIYYREVPVFQFVVTKEHTIKNN